MSQKILRYFLILGVALVWGIIIYRLINNLSDDPGPQYSTSHNPGSFNHIRPQDSFILIANYPDPFIPDEHNTIIDTANEILNHEFKANAKPIVNSTPANELKADFEGIQYLGMISNPAKKKKVAVITISGKEYLVAEKETIQDYHIRKIEKDRVELVFKGKIRLVKKNN